MGWGDSGPLWILPQGPNSLGAYLGSQHSSQSTLTGWALLYPLFRSPGVPEDLSPSSSSYQGPGLPRAYPPSQSCPNTATL